MYILLVAVLLILCYLRITDFHTFPARKYLASECPLSLCCYSVGALWRIHIRPEVDLPLHNLNVLQESRNKVDPSCLLNKKLYYTVEEDLVVQMLVKAGFISMGVKV